MKKFKVIVEIDTNNQVYETEYQLISTSYEKAYDAAVELYEYESIIETAKIKKIIEIN